MEQISVAKIVQSVGMEASPEYYLGRGVSIKDLDGDNLYDIYKIINEKLGSRAADSYESMVYKLYPLSAANFLDALYYLERCQWNIHIFNSNMSEHIRISLKRKIGFERGPREREKLPEADER